MARYRDSKTGRIHRTVDGSRHDRRLDGSKRYEKVDGTADVERSRAASRKRTGTKQSEGDDG